MLIGEGACVFAAFALQIQLSHFQVETVYRAQKLAGQATDWWRDLFS